MRVAAALAALLVTLAPAAAESHAKSRPILLGVLGGRARFDQLTGQQTRVGHVIAAWGQGPVTQILAALGEMPMLGITTGGSLTPRNVALGAGDAFLGDVNRAAAYYPGDAYVDIVADDIYNIHGRYAWAANEQLYSAHPSKPYAIAEWANWGLDDPAFVARIAQFARTHARVELLAYYNGRPGSPFDIISQPRSRAAYRQLIDPLGD